MTEEIKKRIEQINSGIVPEGYKQTKVGVVPLDWINKCISEIGIFSKGKGIPGTEMTDEGIPCIGYGDIYTKYTFCFDKAQNFISQKVADESRKAESGALFFTCSGETALEIGKCVCYTGEEPIYVGGDIAILQTQSNVNSLFLAFQQNIFTSIKQKARYGQGHSVVHIYGDSLGKLGVSYPKEIKEQENIARILSKWDEAIELQEKLIAKLELQKKALMQKLLTPKKGWELIRFGSIIKLQCGYAFKSNQFVEYGIPIIRISNIQDQYIDLSNCVCYKDNKIKEEFQVLENDVLIAMSGATTGKIGVYKYKYTSFLNQRVGKFILIEETYSYEFVKQILLSELFESRLKELLVSGAQPNISASEIENMYFEFPCIRQQYKNASLLSKFDELILQQIKKLQTLKTQQKTMQQLLLTGIVRVNQ